MHQRELVDQPHHAKNTPNSKQLTPKNRDKWPSVRNPCPLCGQLKNTQSKTCNDCRYRRPIVTQPDDPTIRYIPLTRGQIAIVDAVLYAWLMQWHWCAVWSKFSKTYYAARGEMVDGKTRTVLMHRQILTAPDDVGVDHIRTGDTLDNRRSNLRLATASQNCSNRRLRADSTSGYIGVYWHRKHEAWVASIAFDKKRLYLGDFATKEEAAAVRDLKAVELFGKCVVLNFPERRCEYEQQIRSRIG